MKANIKLAAEKSIADHQTKHLIKALSKKTYQRGKRLALDGTEAGGPQLQTPTKIQRARDFQVAKEDQEQDKVKAREVQKANRASKKAQDELEKEERVIQRQITKEERARVQAEKKAIKDAITQSKNATQSKEITPLH